MQFLDGDKAETNLLNLQMDKMFAYQHIFSTFYCFFDNLFFNIEDGVN